jgi:hypothetical protein
MEGIATKPEEIITKLLEEGMSENEIKNELVNFGLSARQIHDLVSEAKKLKEKSKVEAPAKPEKKGFLSSLGLGGKKQEEKAPAKHHDEIDKRIEERLSKLKGTITEEGQVEQVPTPVPEKPKISATEEIKEKEAVVPKPSEESTFVQTQQKMEEKPEESLEELLGEVQKAPAVEEVGEKKEEVAKAAVTKELSEEKQKESVEREISEAPTTKEDISAKLDSIEKHLDKISEILGVLRDINIQLLKILKDKGL